MINFIDLKQEKPFLIIFEKYKDAIEAGQKNIEAISIASYNKLSSEVDSRYVNLKFIENDEFIFFSNYDSPKSSAFKSHNQIAVNIYWSSIDFQIRIKAKIKKTSKKYNNDYFKMRSPEKNALAISSKQSMIISSYEQVIKNYKYVKKIMIYQYVLNIGVVILLNHMKLNFGKVMIQDLIKEIYIN